MLRKRVNTTPARSQRPPASLTPREIEVLRLVAAGMTNNEIGTALSIAQGTVKMHVHNILSKLGVNSRTGAMAKALKYQLL